MQGSPRYTFTDLTGNLQWSTFVNQSSATITSLPNGIYSLKVEDVVGTSVVNEFVDTIQIVGKDSLELIITATDEFCYGDGDGSCCSDSPWRRRRVRIHVDNSIWRFK